MTCTCNINPNTCNINPNTCNICLLIEVPLFPFLLFPQVHNYIPPIGQQSLY